MPTGDNTAAFDAGGGDGSADDFAGDSASSDDYPDYDDVSTGSSSDDTDDTSRDDDGPIDNDDDDTGGGGVGTQTRKPRDDAESDPVNPQTEPTNVETDTSTEMAREMAGDESADTYDPYPGDPTPQGGAVASGERFGEDRNEGGPGQAPDSGDDRGGSPPNPGYDGGKTIFLGPNAPGNPTNEPIAVETDEAGDEGDAVFEAGDDPYVPDDQAGLEEQFGSASGPADSPTADAVQQLEADLSRATDGAIIAGETDAYNITRTEEGVRLELTDEGIEELGGEDTIAGLTTYRVQEQPDRTEQVDVAAGAEDEPGSAEAAQDFAAGGGVVVEPGAEDSPGSAEAAQDQFALQGDVRSQQRRVATGQFEERTGADLDPRADVDVSDGRATLTESGRRAVAEQRFEEQLGTDVDQEDIVLTDEGARLSEDARPADEFEDEFSIDLTARLAGSAVEGPGLPQDVAREGEVREAEEALRGVQRDIQTSISRTAKREIDLSDRVPGLAVEGPGVTEDVAQQGQESAERQAEALVEGGGFIATAPAQVGVLALEGGEAGGEAVDVARTEGTRGVTEFAREESIESGSRAVEGIQTELRTPTGRARLAGSLIGSAALMGGAAAVSSRAGLASRLAIQPGEEALGYGSNFAARRAGSAVGRPGTGRRVAETIAPDNEPVIFSEEFAIRTARGAGGRVAGAAGRVSRMSRGEFQSTDLSGVRQAQLERFRPGGPTEVVGSEANVPAGRSEPLGSDVESGLAASQRGLRQAAAEGVTERRPPSTVEAEPMAEPDEPPEPTPEQRRIADEAMRRQRGRETLSRAAEEIGVSPQASRSELRSLFGDERGQAQLAGPRPRPVTEPELEQDDLTEFTDFAQTERVSELEARREQFRDFGQGREVEREQERTRQAGRPAIEEETVTEEAVRVRTDPLGRAGNQPGVDQLGLNRGLQQPAQTPRQTPRQTPEADTRQVSEVVSEFETETEAETETELGRELEFETEQEQEVEVEAELAREVEFNLGERRERPRQRRPPDDVGGWAERVERDLINPITGE